MTSHADARAPAPRYQHVLVPLDGSEFAADAIRTARGLADRLEADLHTVSVVEAATEMDALRIHAADVIGVDPSDERVHGIVNDDPAGGIERCKAELSSCLVCLSTHGRGRVAGALIGSVARSLLESTREPIVAVGPSAERTSELGSSSASPRSPLRLVACVDGSSSSERVLPVAAAWATVLGMSLTILTVAEPSPPPLRSDARWHRHLGPDEDAEAYIRRIGERWKDAGLELETHVSYDPIGSADGVETYLNSHSAGMIAVTTHARRGLTRFVFGSDATDIVHRATAPVLIVPLNE